MKKLLIVLAVIFGMSLAQYFVAIPSGKASIEQKVVELHITHQKAEKEESFNSSEKVKIVPFGKAICSGEFIDGYGDILTAKHCTDGADAIEVRTFDGKTYDALVLAQSNLHDIAMIHIDRSHTPYFKFARTAIRGQFIRALGSPLGITNVLSEGIIAKIEGDVLLVDCSVLPGNSGGPLFDKDENLVGVVVAGYIVGFGVTHLNVVQSMDSVKPFVAAVLEHYKRGVYNAFQ